MMDDDELEALSDDMRDRLDQTRPGWRLLPDRGEYLTDAESDIAAAHVSAWLVAYRRVGTQTADAAAIN